MLLSVPGRWHHSRMDKPPKPFDVPPGFYRIVRDFVARCEAREAARIAQGLPPETTPKPAADDGVTYRVYWTTPSDKVGD